MFGWLEQNETGYVSHHIARFGEHRKEKEEKERKNKGLVRSICYAYERVLKFCLMWLISSALMCAVAALYSGNGDTAAAAAAAALLPIAQVGR